MPQNRNWSSWLPVILWLVVIALESTDVGSGANTGRLLAYLWSSLFGSPNPVALDLANLLLRKSGHVIGYAVLSWLIFRALRSAWRSRQEGPVSSLESAWQLRWSVIAVTGTLLAATADEIHQSFNPSRTGNWHDVLLDTVGAILLQVVLFLALRHRATRHAYATE